MNNSKIVYAAAVAFAVLIPCSPVRAQSCDGDLATARTRAQAGDLDGARARYETILNAGQPSPRDRARTITVLDELAAIDAQLGDLSRAVALLDREIDLRRKDPADDEVALGVCLNNLAQVRLQMGRPDLARAPGLESVAIARKSGGVTLAHRLVGLAGIHAACRESLRALRADQEALGILDRCSTRERPAALLATCLKGLACAYIFRKDFASAEGTLRRTLDLESSPGGAGGAEGAGVSAWNPDVEECLEAIGMVADRQGHAGPASQAFERALAMLERHWGKEDGHLVGCLVRWITVLQRAGDTQGALVNARRVYRIVCKTQGKESMDTASVLMMAARQHMLEGSYAMAERMCARAVEIVREHTGARSAPVAAGLGRLATVVRYEGRLAQAGALYKQSLRMFKATAGLANSDARHILAGYARLLRATGRAGQAARIESWAQSTSAGARESTIRIGAPTVARPANGDLAAATRG